MSIKFEKQKRGKEEGENHSKCGKASSDVTAVMLYLRLKRKEGQK
jgi:hypothetical protein